MKSLRPLPICDLTCNGKGNRRRLDVQLRSRRSIRSRAHAHWMKAIMTRSTTDDNSVLLVHAYLDGELDPANALGIAQQMSTEPALAAESERVKALQRVIHERLPREERRPGCMPASRRRSAA